MSQIFKAKENESNIVLKLGRDKRTHCPKVKSPSHMRLSLEWVRPSCGSSRIMSGGRATVNGGHGGGWVERERNKQKKIL